MALSNCLSSTASTWTWRLNHSNRPSVVFLPHQLYLGATARGHGCNIRSSSDVAMVIDERAVARDIFCEIRTEVSRMKKLIGEVPRLAVIGVGDRDRFHDPITYKLPCRTIGMSLFIDRLAEDCSEEEVLKSVSRLNHDPSVHGIIVDLPLPLHIDEYNILNAISMEKDIDGVHPLNLGLLAMRGRGPLFLPPAPNGCIELLRRYNFEIKGKTAVVIGRSKNFGMPAALLLQREDATVTIIHSKTKNPEEITRQADIVISAAGKPNMVRGSWIKPGAVIMCVGYDMVWPDPNSPDGFSTGGDICYEEVRKVASAIMPFGHRLAPMTITMRRSNILSSAKRILNFI